MDVSMGNRKSYIKYFFRNVGDVQSDYVRRVSEQGSDSVPERDRPLWVNMLIYRFAMQCVRDSQCFEASQMNSRITD